MEKLRELLKKLLGKKSEQGFTLIEVVIVLAIAGLIFVIVFLAVSSAQRSRRDNARQDAANRMLAAAEQYAGSKNGAYPTVVADFDNVFNNNGNPDNSGTTWTRLISVAAVPPAIGTLYFSVGSAGCSADGTVPAAGTGRVARVQTKLESGVLYCRDNA
ncbi:type II secretion system protein [Candidatus Microgenomates bacterium]|nr:type II secretion system protein [Candidatus Microgenomates bacterium]